MDEEFVAELGQLYKVQFSDGQVKTYIGSIAMEDDIEELLYQEIAPSFIVGEDGHAYYVQYMVKLKPCQKHVRWPLKF
ncbi:MAG: hypothetical protein ACXADH_12385 [Candidatus Kariarchaeaceae archaeon]|jgi:hypothetical protein